MDQENEYSENKNSKEMLYIWCISLIIVLYFNCTIIAYQWQKPIEYMKCCMHSLIK